MKCFCVKLSLVLAGWLTVASVSWAGISYEYTTDSNNYSAATPGQTVTVSVYLQEVLTSGSSSLIVAEGGVGTAGFYVKQTGTIPSGASTVSAIAANGNSATGTGTNASDGFGPGPTVNSNHTTTQARLVEANQASPGAMGAPNSSYGGGQQVLLGTVTFVAGSAGTTTTYALQTYVNAPTGTFGGSGQNGNTVDYFANDLDVSTTTAQGATYNYTGANSYVNQGTGLGYNTFTITVAGTPEPSSVILCSLTIGGLAIVAYRRRKLVAGEALSVA